MDELRHGRSLLSIIVAYFALWISGKIVENKQIARNAKIAKKSKLMQQPEPRSSTIDTDQRSDPLQFGFFGNSCDFWQFIFSYPSRCRASPGIPRRDPSWPCQPSHPSWHEILSADSLPWLGCRWIWRC